MKEFVYTIIIERKRDGYLHEGKTCKTAEECWERIEDMVKEYPFLLDVFNFSVVEHYEED